MQDDPSAALTGAEAAGFVFALGFYVVIGIVYAIIVYVVARKRRVNPWPWAIPTLIPIFGVMIGALFMVLSFLSVLDRLNKLETETPFS